MSRLAAGGWFGLDSGPSRAYLRAYFLRPVWARTVARRASPDAGSAFGTVPLGYLGEPTGVAHAIVFLVSQESRHIAGARLVTDGGRFMV
ncbi:MAG: SDR family oxidoreductase [Candidatus Rokubacteria bacterium]|nr:SDR family oxidoreductase [Candidatus Rokubacteria bacterium]